MKEEIRKQLFEVAEQQYKDFSTALIPDAKPLIGVRLPILRKLAKQLAKQENWQQLVCSYEGEYQDLFFEETMLRGMVIGYATEKAEVEVGLQLLAEFIPQVGDWSVCDSFCNSFTFAARHQEETWDFLQPYLQSEKEFEVRVAIILLMIHFLKSDTMGKKLSRKRKVSMLDVRQDNMKENLQKYPYVDKILHTLNRPFSQGYYAQMAAAWTTAEAFVTFPFETAKLLEQDCHMDAWTYRKALQKICESRVPDEEVKAYIRALKK